MSINTWTIMGRLTRDPELKTAGEQYVCRFNVAVDDRYKRDKTHFFEVVAWRQKAEFVSNYFHKGDMIAVTGSGSQDNWEAPDGTKKTKTYLLAEEVSFCGSKRETTEAAPAETPERAAPRRRSPVWKPEEKAEQKPEEYRQTSLDNEYRRVIEDDDLPFE